MDYGKTAITTDHYSRKILFKKSWNKKTLINKLIECIIMLILIKLYDSKLFTTKLWNIYYQNVIHSTLLDFLLSYLMVKSISHSYWLSTKSEIYLSDFWIIMDRNFLQTTLSVVFSKSLCLTIFDQLNFSYFAIFNNFYLYSFVHCIFEILGSRILQNLSRTWI